MYNVYVYAPLHTHAHIKEECCHDSKELSTTSLFRSKKHLIEPAWRSTSLFACVGPWGFGDERLTRISKFFQVCWMDEAELQSQIAAKLQPGWGTKGARHLANSPS